MTPAWSKITFRKSIKYILPDGTLSKLLWKPVPNYLQPLKCYPLSNSKESTINQLFEICKPGHWKTIIYSLFKFLTIKTWVGILGETKTTEISRAFLGILSKRLRNKRNRDKDKEKNRSRDRSNDKEKNKKLRE